MARGATWEGWTCWGPERGGCGQAHRTWLSAWLCRQNHQSFLFQNYGAGMISDRVVVRARVEQLRRTVIVTPMGETRDPR